MTPFGASTSDEDWHDELVATLELLGERDIDPTTAVYERLFARLPGARALFVHGGQAARGRMCHEVFNTLLDAALNRGYLPGLLHGYVNDHRTYGHVNVQSYGLLLEAVCDSLAELLGDDWTAARNAAWRGCAARLMTLVQEADRQALVPLV